MFRQSLNLRSDDMVICTSHTYRAVRYAIDECITRHDADVLCLDIPKYINDEDKVILDIDFSYNIEYNQE